MNSIPTSHTAAVPPARILIVDDEPANNEVLAIILMREGFVVVAAGSGAEALASVALEPPDLMLLDLMMPEMSGYQVMAKMKGNAATENIPIIMLSALSDHATKLRALSAGADDFLGKPMDRAELYVRVRKLLALKTRGD